MRFPKKNTNSPWKDLTASHVAIRTSEYEKLLSWYQETLDFQVIQEWQVGEMLLAFIAPAGNSDFIIEVLGHPNELATSHQARSGYDHICFDVDNLDASIRLLQEKGIQIDRQFPVAAIGKRVAFITDPFGNTIKFIKNLTD